MNKDEMNDFTFHGLSLVFSVVVAIIIIYCIIK